MIAAIALGSNLPSAYGSPEETLWEAIRRLEDLGKVIAVSNFYLTEPVGFLDQPNFVNAAALLETEFSPLILLRNLLEIEKTLGRDRRGTVLKGPRTLDLDLLLFGQEVLNDPELNLPHPSMHERAFVLKPLAEVAPQWLHPVLGKTVAELAGQLSAE